MREKYESLSAGVLKDLCRAREIKGISKMKKEELVEAMLAQDEIDAAHQEKTAEKKPVKRGRPAAAKKEAEEAAEPSIEEAAAPEEAEDKEEKEEKEIPHYEDEKPCNGILEVLAEGYGFIRCENYMPGENDVYVSPSQIRKFNLKTGDIITGRTRKNNPNDKYGALL